MARTDPQATTSATNPTATAVCRKSQPTVDKYDTHILDTRISDLARTQHGVFTIGQLVDFGLSRQAVSARAAAARLHRIHHGVYALAPSDLLTPDGRLMAAVLACGPLAALSFQPAARLHGLLDHRSTQPHVTVPGTNGRKRPNIRIHRSRTLQPDIDIATVVGIPCTTVHRTIFDLAAILSTRQLERLLDQALTLNLLDLNALTDQIARNPGRTHNRAALTRVLNEHRVGSTVTWNELEERFLALVRAAGLPRPEVQPWLDLQDGEPPIRPDFLWRDQRLIVETDGWATHGGRHSFERDRRRDQRAAARGFQTLRATWRQIASEPRRLQATVAAVVAASLTAEAESGAGTAAAAA